MSSNSPSYVTTLLQPILKPTGLDGIVMVGIAVLIFLALVVLWWVRTKLTLDTRNCDNMNKLYGEAAQLTTMSFTNSTKDFFLRDYYIKTAYNCCASGQFKNDFVNVCALKNCLKQGARCLDFEIYSVDNKPVIAVSSLTDFYVKETFNSVPFATAMQVVADYAFASSVCSNSGDPLILHLRMQTNNRQLCDNIASTLQTVLGDKLLDAQYSYENNYSNFGAVPLSELMGKVIVIVDKTHALFEGTKLAEFVNMASGQNFMRILRAYDVQFNPDLNELITFNKEFMSISLPDLKANAVNQGILMPMNAGVQMIGLCFQKYDANMMYYQKMFNKAGTAFILKPEKLRYKAVLIGPPKPAPATWDSAEKAIDAGGIPLDISMKSV